MDGKSYIVFCGIGNDIYVLKLKYYWVILGQKYSSVLIVVKLYLQLY